MFLTKTKYLKYGFLLVLLICVFDDSVFWSIEKENYHSVRITLNNIKHYKLNFHSSVRIMFNAR